MVKLDTIGKILEGDQVGWYVKVEYDTASGGYYIYQFKNKVEQNGLGEAYDDWLESLEDVQGYFEESDWNIDWSE